MDVILTNLAGNKLFTGLILLMSNIGGKYLVIDMPRIRDPVIITHLKPWHSPSFPKLSLMHNHFVSRLNIWTITVAKKSAGPTQGIPRKCT